MNERLKSNANQNFRVDIQGDFFNWHPALFAKCWPVSNQFKKKHFSPRLAPPMIEKRPSVWQIECDSNTLFQFRGVSVQANLGGASLGL